MKKLILKKHHLLMLLFFTSILLACEKEDPKPSTLYNVMNGFVINNEGMKFLATDVGLLNFDSSSGEYTINTSGLDMKPVNDLHVSIFNPLKEVWMGGNTGALNYNTQESFNSSNSGLANDNVIRIGVDVADRMLFGTDKSLSMLVGGEWLLSYGKNDLYKNYNITDIASTSNGFSYVSTNGGGVEAFELGLDGVSGATIWDEEWTKLPTNTINTIYTKDTIQVFGTDEGVAFHWSEYMKWDWEIYKVSDGLVNNNVQCIASDDEGNWWFGTSNGLSKFNETWTSYTLESHHIISNDIKCLAIDVDGSLWLATDSGLSQFKNEQWVNYPKK